MFCMCFAAFVNEDGVRHSYVLCSRGKMIFPFELVDFGGNGKR